VTTEIDRMKVLEGKIGLVLEHINRLTAENEKFKAQVKELKAEKKDMEELARKAGKLDEELKRAENEREALKARIEAVIGQIDKLGI
jgi:uncharacterized protein YdcH (DUF465 family)